MRKLVYGGVLLALVGVSVIGCKKSTIKPQEENIESESQQLKTTLYRTDGKMLIFNTVRDFDATIEIADDKLHTELKGLGFPSYAETLNEGDKNLIESEFLSCVVNKDFIVQIGNYIYKINKPNKQVFALSINNPEFYNDLIAENTTNKYILGLSTDDDVFELLGEIESTGKGSNSCRNAKSDADGGWSQYADFTDVDNIYGKGTDKRYKFEKRFMVKYDSWGVYKKLFIEFKHNETWGGIWDETYFAVAYESSYNVKGGGSSTTTHYLTYPFATTATTVNVPTSSYEYYDDNKEIILYHASKCLKGYDLKAWCYMRRRDTLKHWLIPAAGYLRINDNLDVW